jgi:hypothetical protein
MNFIFFILLFYCNIILGKVSTLIDINNDNFDINIKSKDVKLWLMLFYDPECLNCKELDNNINEIFYDLNNNYNSIKENSKILIGNINKNDNKELCNKFNINKFPSIVYFINKGLYYNNLNENDYTKENISLLIELLKYPTINYIKNDAELNLIINNNKLTFLLTITDLTLDIQNIISIYKNISIDLLNYKFAIKAEPTTKRDQPIYKIEKIENGNFNDNKVIVMNIPINYSYLKELIYDNIYPIIHQIDDKNFQKLSSKEKILIIYVYYPDKSLNIEINNFELIINEIPINISQQFIFGILDGAKHVNFVNRFDNSNDVSSILFLEYRNYESEEFYYKQLFYNNAGKFCLYYIYYIVF